MYEKPKCELLEQDSSTELAIHASGFILVAGLAIALNLIVV